MTDITLPQGAHHLRLGLLTRLESKLNLDLSTVAMVVSQLTVRLLHRYMTC